MKKFVYLLVVVQIFMSCAEDTDDPISSIRDEITDSWLVNESNSLYKKSIKEFYKVDIFNDESDSNYVDIYNFYNIGDDYFVKARVTDDETLVISNAVVNSYIIDGEGVISSRYDQIDWEYYVDDGSGEIDTVVAEYTIYE